MPAGYDVTYKVLIIGEAGVGKTALLNSLMGEQFSMNMLTTVGIDFVKKTFLIDGANVLLQIWDTAGQERFRTITKFQYRGTKGILLVYDVTNRKSYEAVNFWLDSLENEIQPDHPSETVPIVMVGNKCDLNSIRQVEFNEGKHKAREFLVKGFMETSAKEKVNITQAFEKLAQSMIDLYHPHLMDSYLPVKQQKSKQEMQKRDAAIEMRRKSDLKRRESIKISKNNQRKVPNFSSSCCQTG